MMRRAIIVFTWAAGLLVALLIVLVVTVLVIDPDSYRPRVERELSQLLGRAVSAERLSVSVSLIPTLSVRGLRIANPPWASRPYFLVADNSELSLDLIELIHGRLEIGSVSVHGLDLLLEQDDDGVGNWQFPRSSSTGGQKDAAQLPDFDTISLSDSAIVWRGGSGDSVNVHVKDADAVLRSDSPLELEAELNYRQTPIAVELRARDSLQNMLNGRPVSASIKLRSVETGVDLEVDAPQLFDLGASSVNFAGKGKRLDALSTLAGRPLPGWGPYRLSGTATLSGGAVRFTNLRMLVEGLAATPSLPVSRVQIESGDISLGREEPTSFQIAGKLNETSFTLDMNTAELPKLVAAQDNIALKVRATLEDFEFGAEGEVSRAAESRSVDLASYVKGDIGVPGRFFGARPFTHPLRADLSGRIKVDATEIRATGLRGTVAQCTVAGDLNIQRTAPLRLGGALKLGRLDIAAFGIESDKTQPERKQQTDAAPPEWMSAFDADLQLQVESIVGLAVAMSDLSARGTLEKGRLEVHKFRGIVRNTKVLADAGLQWKNKRPYVDAKIDLPVLDFSKNDTESSAASKKNDKHQVNADRLDTRFPFAPLRTFDGDFTLNIGRLDGMPVPVKSLSVSTQLRRGTLRAPQLNVTLADVPVRSVVMLDASSDDAKLTANVSTERIDVASLLKVLKKDVPVAGAIGRTSVTVDTKGTSPRAWIRNAKVDVHVAASTLQQRGGNERLSVERASAIASPGVPARVEMRGQFREFPIEIVVTGGELADLLDGRPSWPQVSAELHATVKGQSLVVTAQSGLESLMRGRDIPVRVQAHMKGARAIVAGTIVDIDHPERTPLNATITIDSLARLPFELKDSHLPDIPFNATANVVVDEQEISLSQLVIRSGSSDLAGKVNLTLDKRAKVVANLSGKLLDISPYRSAQAKTPAEGSSGSAADQPFDLKWLRLFDADISVRTQQYISPRLDLDDFRVKAVIDHGLLKLSVAVEEGNSHIDIGFNAAGKVPTAAVRISIKDLDLEKLKQADVARLGSNPKVTVTAQFTGIGATPRQMYASTKGFAVISRGPGLITTKVSPFLVQSLSTNLLQVLLPGKKPDDFNQLECAAARVDVKDGVASSPDGIALRFKRMDILGSGSIELSTGKILFGFKAVRRRWLDFTVISVAGNFAIISGTLENPKVGLDTQGLLIQGGAAWATAGLSLLATDFLRTMSSSKDPCAAIVEKGRTDTDPIDTLMKSLHLPGQP